MDLSAGYAQRLERMVINVLLLMSFHITSVLLLNK